MGRILFKNCSVWDGSGAAAYPADVLVEGERIRAVGAGVRSLAGRDRLR